jgi:hypothetical protein
MKKKIVFKPIEVVSRPAEPDGLGHEGLVEPHEGLFKPEEVQEIQAREKALEELKELLYSTPTHVLINFTMEKMRLAYSEAQVRNDFYEYIRVNSFSENGVKFVVSELKAYLELKEPPQKPAGGTQAQDADAEDNKKEFEHPGELPIPESFQQELQDGDDPLEVLKQVLAKASSFSDVLKDILQRLGEVERQIKAHGDCLSDIPSHSIVLHLIHTELNQFKFSERAKDTTQEYVIKYPSGATKKMTKKVPPCWNKLLDLATCRDNIFLAGPTQCGKTTTAEMVAEALDLRFSALSCSEGLDESIFAGSLLPVGENGKFEYVPSTFVDFYENGGVFLLDEFCSSDSNLAVFMNNAIGNDHFFLPRRFDRPLIKKHPDFICIAADNTLGHGGDDVYVGRNQMDASTMERFRTGFLIMDYNPTVEKAITDPEVYEWALGIRKIIKDLKLSNRHMTTRTMKRFTIMKNERNWDIADMQKVYFADWPVADMQRVLKAMKSKLQQELEA